jgi:uncharacterized protein (DUF736 family)
MAKENELGALWLKDGKNGKYMSGKLTTPGGEDVQIVVFKNNYKQKDNQPDYRILKSEPKGASNAQEQAVKDVFEDDTPF